MDKQTLLEQRVTTLERQVSLLLKTQASWVSSKQLAKYIPQLENQSEASRINFLRGLRDQGVLQPQVHWVNRGKGRRPIYMYNPQAVLDALNLYYQLPRANVS
jgi:hypothetical protein